MFIFVFCFFFFFFLFFHFFSSQAVLLGAHEQGGDELSSSIAGPARGPSSARLIVKTKRALWIELRKLVVLGYALVIRNEGELVENCIRSTLDHIRKDASGDLK
jgi:hypothetical protein